MASSATFTHDPDAIIDYTISWADWLGDAETLSSAVWTLSDDDLTNVDDSVSSTASTIRVSGGTAGVAYTATCHVTTSTGQEDDRTIRLVVRDR